jgi:uncharacterized protein DUF6116
MGSFFNWARTLRFRQLFFLTLIIFLGDLVIPDLIPLVDEVLLGLMTLILGSLRKKTGPKETNHLK